MDIISHFDIQFLFQDFPVASGLLYSNCMTNARWVSLLPLLSLVFHLYLHHQSLICTLQTRGQYEFLYPEPSSLLLLVPCTDCLVFFAFRRVFFRFSELPGQIFFFTLFHFHHPLAGLLMALCSTKASRKDWGPRNPNFQSILFSPKKSRSQKWPTRLI